jgi:hypothetical protein
MWWFTSGSIGKLLPRRILAQVVSSSSCERNWSSYSFVHSKARNRLLSSRAEDLVYVYTNSRVLNQNVPFTDEAATEWYRQSVVSEDSDSEGLADLFDDYDDFSDFDIPSVSIDDENTQGRSQQQDGLQLQGQGIKEDGRDLQDWAAQNVNGLYVKPPR